MRYRIDGILYDMEAVPKKVQDAGSQPRQGHGQDGHRRAPPAAGRPRDDQDRRRARSTCASPRCRRTTASASSCASSTRRRKRLHARRDRPRPTSNLEIVRAVHRLSPRHHLRHRARPARARRRRSTRRCREINSTQKNVITIEDPIEYHLPGISQVQVNDKKGLTFAAGLRSFLRQDPDVMMVGEIRDVETAAHRDPAALTGHLVFSTAPHERLAPAPSRACSTSASSPTSSRRR